MALNVMIGLYWVAVAHRCASKLLLLLLPNNRGQPTQDFRQVRVLGHSAVVLHHLGAAAMSWVAVLILWDNLQAGCVASIASGFAVMTAWTDMVVFNSARLAVHHTLAREQHATATVLMLAALQMAVLTP